MGVGNVLDNVLVGNSLDNQLYGGNGGSDTMIGGLGNDTYYVGYGSVVEDANAGIDTVHSWVDHILSANVENLTLEGTAIAGVGNSQNNIITGNALNNSIDGGSGSDSLIGGTGNDTYLFKTSSGNDTISDSAGTDIVSFDSSVSKNNVAVFMSGTDLVVDYGSTVGQDKIVLLGQSTSATTVEKFQLSDGTFISNTDVNQLIQTMTAYATANSIQMTSVSDVRNNQDLMTMVASSWHS